MRTDMKQKGFTLIELVVVIVILGILAATAIPKFIDLSVDAADAAAAGTAGALSSALTVNFAKSKAGTGATSVGSTTKCSDLKTLLQSWPANIDFATDSTLSTCTASGINDSTSCVLQHTKGTSPAPNGAVTVICTTS